LLAKFLEGGAGRTRNPAAAYALRVFFGAVDRDPHEAVVGCGVIHMS
jgi:hypothetical protein